jgi:CRP-like cAMP-binding protein
MNQNCFVADLKLFQALEKRSKSYDCKENRVIFSQGDIPGGLYIIRDGEASLVMLSPADEIISSFRAGPGSVLGLPAVVGSTPYSLHATARKGSSIGFIAQGEFNDLLREDPSLYPSVLNLLAVEVRAAREALARLSSSLPIRRPSARHNLAEAPW